MIDAFMWRRLTARHGDVFLFHPRIKSQPLLVPLLLLYVFHTDKMIKESKITPPRLSLLSPSPSEGAVAVRMTAGRVDPVIFVSRVDLSDTSCPQRLHNLILSRCCEN